MTAAEIADQVARVVHPDQVVELRALNVGGPRRTVAGWFDGRHLFDLARTALALTRQASGVYFTPNPVHPALLDRCPNRAEEYRRGRFHLTTDEDVLERRYLLVDFDPDRTDGNNDQPSTDDEWGYADSASAVVEMDLTHTGWRKPLRMLSGNGVHLLFPLSAPLPAKPPGYEPDPLREILAIYREWKFCDRVKVDPNTYTAARMLKVPGTTARKGEAAPDRPFRTATILELPDDWPAPAQPPAPPARDRADVPGVQPHPAAPPSGGRGDRDRRRARRREAPAGAGLFDQAAAVDPGAER